MQYNISQVIILDPRTQTRSLEKDTGLKSHNTIEEEDFRDWSWSCFNNAGYT